MPKTSSASEPQGRRNSAVGVGTAFAVLFGLVLASWVLWDRGGRPSDFSPDYFAGKALLEGASIYGPEVSELGRAELGQDVPPNLHPPSLIVLLLPLALIPYRAAFMLLGFASIGLYVASVLLAIGATGAGDRRSPWLFLALLWWPFWACLTHGQVSMAVAAALTAAWFCDQRERPVAAGALVGVAVLFKLFPALVGLYFLFRGNRRALTSMTVVVAAGFALSAMVVGPGDFVRYWQELAPLSSARWSSHPLNVSIHGLLQVLLGETAWGTEPAVSVPAVVLPLRALLSTAIVGATAIIGVRSLRHTELGASRLFGGLCVAAVLLSPITWSHTLAIVLLPLLVELARCRSTRERLVLAVLAFVIIGFPGPPIGRLIAPLLTAGAIPWMVTAVFQAPALGLLILWWRLILEPERAAPW